MGLLSKKKTKAVKEEAKEKPEEETEEEEILEAPTPPKKEDEPIWSLKEVPSQYTERVYNNETEESLDLNQAIVRILNEIEDIKEFLSE